MAAMNLNTEQFYNMMEEGKTILLDFWAPWCVYCRRISAAYDKLAEQYGDKLVIAKINIDDEPLAANREQIQVIPTLVLYQGGEAIANIVAPESKAKIEEFLRNNLDL